MNKPTGKLLFAYQSIANLESQLAKANATIERLNYLDKAKQEYILLLVEECDEYAQNMNARNPGTFSSSRVEKGIKCRENISKFETPKTDTIEREAQLSEAQDKVAELNRALHRPECTSTIPIDIASCCQNPWFVIKNISDELLKAKQEVVKHISARNELANVAEEARGFHKVKLSKAENRIAELERYLHETLYCANNGKDIGLCPQCRDFAQRLKENTYEN